jgi:hypothetical protein
MKRPKLSEAFAEGLAIAAKNRGGWAYVPSWLIGSLLMGAIAATFIPASFWSDSNWGVSVTFYGGLLAFDGLLLAIGWGAFSKIYEIIGAGDFAAFLRRNGLLNIHLLFVDLAQLSMVAAALATGIALVAVLCPLAMWVDRGALAISLGLSCYAIVKAVAATQAMHDLLWDKTNQPLTAPSTIARAVK